MRVTTHSVDEFLESLRHVEDVFDRTVRVSILRNPIGAGRDNVAYSVVIQASAVVLVDDSQYLLDCGQFCGKDIDDVAQDFVGTDKANLEKGRITDYANHRKWRVLPGVISE